MKKLLIGATVLALAGCNISETDNSNDQRNVTIGFDWQVDSGPMAYQLSSDEFGSYLETDSYLIEIDGVVDDDVGLFSLSDTISISVINGSKIYIYSDHRDDHLNSAISETYTLVGEHTIGLNEESSITIPLTNEYYNLITVEDNEKLLGVVLNDEVLEETEAWYRHAFVTGDKYRISLQMQEHTVSREMDVAPGFHHHFYPVFDENDDIDFDYEESWDRIDFPIEDDWCAYTKVENLICSGYSLDVPESWINFSFSVTGPEYKVASQAIDVSFDMGDLTKGRIYFYDAIREQERWFNLDDFESEFHHSTLDFYSEFPDEPGTFAKVEGSTTDDDPKGISIVKFVDSSCRIHINLKGDDIEFCNENHVKTEGLSLVPGEDRFGVTVTYYDVYTGVEGQSISEIMEPIIKFGEDNTSRIVDMEFAIEDGSFVRWVIDFRHTPDIIDSETWEEFLSEHGDKKLRTADTGHQLKVNFRPINDDEPTVIHLDNIEFGLL